MARKTRSNRIDTAKAQTGDTRNMRALSRGSGRRFPTLYAGVFGRVEPVYATLTQLDYLAPFASGRALPQAPSDPDCWERAGWSSPAVSA